MYQDKNAAAEIPFHAEGCLLYNEIISSDAHKCLKMLNAGTDKNDSQI